MDSRLAHGSVCSRGGKNQGSQGRLCEPFPVEEEECQLKKPGSSGYGGQGSSSGSGSSSRITTNADGTKNFPVPIDTCLHYKKKGHYKRDCPDFLKSLLRRSKDEITFVDESLYLEYSVNTWWIESGATVHVPILCRCSIQGGTFQGAKERLVWPTGRKMKSKPLEI